MFKREFKQMCDNYGIKAKPTTYHNPQANAIIERVHKVANDMLRSFDLKNEYLEEVNPFDYFLQSTAWSIRIPITQHCRQHPVNFSLAEK